MHVNTVWGFGFTLFEPREFDNIGKFVVQGVPGLPPPCATQYLGMPSLSCPKLKLPPGNRATLRASQKGCLGILRVYGDYERVLGLQRAEEIRLSCSYKAYTLIRILAGIHYVPCDPPNISWRVTAACLAAACLICLDSPSLKIWNPEAVYLSSARPQNLKLTYHSEALGPRSQAQNPCPSHPTCKKMQ